MTDDLPFLRRAAIVLGLVALCVAVWFLRQILLLLFAAIVLSIFIRSLSEPLQRRFAMPHWLALGSVLLALIALLGLIFIFFGLAIEQQITQALDLLPKAVDRFVAWVGSSALGSRLMGTLQESQVPSAIPTLMKVPTYALTVVGGLADLLLVLAGGIYLAAQPDLYRKGALRLIPASERARWSNVIDRIAGDLRKWMVSQLVAMLVVGLMVGLAMWIIGVPVPLALGLFAGIAEFVPIAGPIVSAVPAILLALLTGLDAAGWTLLSFVVIQMVEGNLLIPVIQQEVVRIPPLVTLFAIVVAAAIFGPVGIVMATPLSIVVLVLVERLESQGAP